MPRDELKQRTLQCFQAVFPELPPDEIERLSMAGYPQWDSVATVTLLAVVEEEFAVSVPAEEMENLVSFDLTLDFVERAVGSAGR